MRRQSDPSGFVLLWLLFFLTAITVTLGVLIPTYWMQSRRDMEAELIFRGGEYARAIRKFHRRYGALPQTVDELVRGRDGVPSLRRRYRDPSSNEEFRPIYLNADGTLVNSIYPTIQEARPIAAETAWERAAVLVDLAGPAEEPRLVGVGSTTDEMAVKVYLDQDRYLRWEFIANLRGTRTSAPPTPGATTAPVP